MLCVMFIVRVSVVGNMYHEKAELLLGIALRGPPGLASGKRE